MLNVKAQLEAATRDLERSAALPAYEAVDVIWVAVIKIANLEAGRTENDRFTTLLNRFPSVDVSDLLTAPSIDALLDLQPPLESIRTFVHERLDVEKTARELHSVRDKRASEPSVALTSLSRTLKRIRNRRVHGFKTADGPRDEVILGAAADILRRLCSLAIRLRA